MTVAAARGLSILLVEDNQDHAELTLKALESSNSAYRVFWVKDGEEALDFLQQKGRWAGANAAPRPGLVLLDVNLPKVGGHEVLRRIKADEALRAIPVVMLTTSDRDEEVAASYLAGVNSFVTKPVRFSDFVERIKSVKGYWVATNRLPEG
jgi:two-component system, response regulator